MPLFSRDKRNRGLPVLRRRRRYARLLPPKSTVYCLFSTTLTAARWRRQRKYIFRTRPGSCAAAQHRACSCAAIYCANEPNMSWHSGESDAACAARHCTMRPPPGGTSPHSARTSPPQAERNTNSTSRGRIGRNTNGAAAGAASGAAVAASVAAPPCAGAPPSAGAAATPDAAPPPAALTACWQFAESFDLFCFRQFSAAAPPVGTLAQCAI